ncbi:MAG: phytoene desaturase family protein [Balneolaceae bacterium]
MTGRDRKQDIIVIGAGLGGLAAASQLAAAGYRVRVVERNAAPGGKMQELKISGYRFDTGPSLLTMPDILRNLFRKCGAELDDYLTLTEPDPLCRYVYPDNTVFDNHQDPVKTVDEIESFAPGEGPSYRRFLDYSKKLYQKTEKSFLFNPLYQWSDLKHVHLSDAFSIDAFTTVSARIDSRFRSDKLRQYFKRFSTYSGSSPFQAPATLNVIPYIEIIRGGYYVRGGLYRIAEALERLALGMGAKIRYNTGVRRILVSNNHACGVELENGETMRCSLLVSNSDASETILNLLDDNPRLVKRKSRQAKTDASASGFVMLLGTNRQWDQLRHHNIFFSGDYEKEFRQIFQHRQLPDDPTIYVANTSFSDPDHAPAGGSNLFVLVNAPAVSPGQDWNRYRKQYPTVIVKKLEEQGLKNLSDTIQVRRIITPPDFYKNYRSDRGSIYGTSSNNMKSAFYRPRNKLREIGGIYLVGGSTHPGGGIPLVILSAIHAVALINRFE